MYTHVCICTYTYIHIDIAGIKYMYFCDTSAQLGPEYGTIVYDTGVGLNYSSQNRGNFERALES